MGGVARVPVNEAAHLLARFSPETLDALKLELGDSADDISEGIWAGEADVLEPEHEAAIALAHAKVVLAALRTAQGKCDEAIVTALRRMLVEKRVKLGGQVASVFGSSGVLGALGATKPVLAAISGLLALLGALAALLSDYLQQIVDTKVGNLSAVYLTLAESRYQAGVLAAGIQIHVDLKHVGPALDKLVGEGNELCRKINGAVAQVIDRLTMPKADRPAGST